MEKANNFTILSLNVQSLNAKFDQIQILISQLKSKHVQFNAICLQETWLTENSDLPLFQIPGYTLISQGAICSSHAGLAIYVQEKKNNNNNFLLTQLLTKKQILYQKPTGPNPVGKSLPIMFAIVRTAGASPGPAELTK